MQIVQLEPIGDTLAIRWDDGTDCYIKLESLRRHCPCAGCKGEIDIMGNLYKGPDHPLGPKAFTIVGLDLVGGYGLQPRWADGHSSGIFSFEYLRRVAASESGM